MCVESENIRNVVSCVTGNNDFRQAVSELSDMHFDSLMERAAIQWDAIGNGLKGSVFESVPIGPIAEACSLTWPSTRYNDPIGRLLDFENPQRLLDERGMGKLKVRTLLCVFLGLGDLVANGNSESFAIQNSPLERTIPLPADPVARVEMFWPRIREKIASSEIVVQKFSTLARRWGVAWPTHSHVEYSLGDVVRMDSLSQFMKLSRGLGKKKMPSIATIIWRAWTEVEPDGPAGPPKSANEVAVAEFEAMAGNADILGVIQKCLDLAGLNQRERSILERRYGLANAAPMTLEEIGQADSVTRERIRQIQQLAEKRIMDNQTSSGFLKLALQKEIPDILRQLEKNSASPLLNTDGEWHRNLIPAHSFLIEVVHGSVRQLLDRLVVDGSIQKTSAGWWLGARLPAECSSLAEWAKERFFTENRPLPLAILAEEKGVLIEELTNAVLSAGFRIEMGYIFRGRLSAPEKRCLFALKVAANYQKWLWSELEFYQAAKAMSEDASGSPVAPHEGTEMGVVGEWVASIKD